MTHSLVIGASGLVGNELMRVLAARGIDATGTRLTRGEDGPVLDVRDAAATKALIDDAQPKVIYLPTNQAGGVERCETHEAEARALFIDGTRNVLEAAAAHDAKVVFFSTDYVYDGAAAPYDEQPPVCPMNAYGRLKAEAEALVLAQPGNLVVRTSVVFGWNPVSRDFAMQVWQRLSAGERMRVPNDQVSNPTLASYLAETTIQLVEAGAAGIFNVVGHDAVTRTEFGRRLAGLYGLDHSLMEGVPTSAIDFKAPRPLNTSLSPAKAEAFLGMRAPSLDEALAIHRVRWIGDPTKR